MFFLRWQYIAVLIVIVGSVSAGFSGLAIAADEPSSPEWTPPANFPSVAVAKIDGNGDLQLLIPTREYELVSKTEEYTVNVPYLETVDGVEKQLMRQESRTRDVSVQICGNTYKMVRTSIPSQSIELTDILGKSVPQDQLKQVLLRATYIVLGSSAPSPFVINMLRKDALFLSIDKIDPEYHKLPAVQGLPKKWTRTEGALTTAVAQMDPKNEHTMVTVALQKMVPEQRTRTVKRTDGNDGEVAYTVMVAHAELVQKPLHLEECEMETVGGEQITLAQATERLASPCRIFLECEIGDYIGSVLEPDTLVIRKKAIPGLAPTSPAPIPTSPTPRPTSPTPRPTPIAD